MWLLWCDCWALYEWSGGGGECLGDLLLGDFERVGDWLAEYWL